MLDLKIINGNCFISGKLEKQEGLEDMPETQIE